MAEAAAVAAAEVVAQRPDVPLAVVVRTALASSREALARTPEQLVEPRARGVVDAGGRLRPALGGPRPVVLGDPVSAPAAPQARPQGAPVAAFALTAHEYTTGPAYEVMYLLESSDERAVSWLRERLDALGDSVLVVGDAAEGSGASTPMSTTSVRRSRPASTRAALPIHVTRFADQIEEHHGAHLAANATPTAAAPRADLGLVAGVGGDGLIEAFRAAGAVVVPSRPRRRASVAQLLDACRATAASEVILLSADADLELAARAAAGRGRGGHHRRGRRGLLTGPGVGRPGRLPGVRPPARPHRRGHGRRGRCHGIRGRDHRRASRAARRRWRRGDILGVVRGEITHVGADLATIGRQVLRSRCRGGEPSGGGHPRRRCGRAGRSRRHGRPGRRRAGAGDDHRGRWSARHPPPHRGGVRWVRSSR